MRHCRGPPACANQQWVRCLVRSGQHGTNRTVIRHQFDAITLHDSGHCSPRRTNSCGESFCRVPQGHWRREAVPVTPDHGHLRHMRKKLNVQIASQLVPFPRLTCYRASSNLEPAPADMQLGFDRAAGPHLTRGLILDSDCGYRGAACCYPQPVAPALHIRQRW